MTLYWFRPGAGGRTTQQLLEELKPFGIGLQRRSRFGCVVYRDEAEDVLVKEVGEVTLQVRGPAVGRILAWPRRDSTDAEVQLLLRCAEKAFNSKPTTATGWVFKRRKNTNWWTTTILRTLGPDEDEQSAFRQGEQLVAEEHVERQLEAAP